MNNNTANKKITPGTTTNAIIARRRTKILYFKIAPYSDD